MQISQGLKPPTVNKVARTVQFPLEKKPGTNLIVYPDKKCLFHNVVIKGDTVIADYTGPKALTKGERPKPDKPGKDLNVEALNKTATGKALVVILKHFDLI